MLDRGSESRTSASAGSASARESTGYEAGTELRGPVGSGATSATAARAEPTGDADTAAETTGPPAPVGAAVAACCAAGADAAAVVKGGIAA